MPDQRCLLTVVGEQNQVDLAVPADAPITEYIDLLARLCGQPEDDALPPAWSLAPVGAAPLPLTASLAQYGIVDGQVLYLRDLLAAEGDEPVIRSVGELVAEFGDGRDAIRWDTAARIRALVVLGGAWLIAAFAYLSVTGRGGLGVAPLAAIAGLMMAGTARLLARYPHVLARPLRSALGCGVIPCMALAFMLVLGTGSLPLNSSDLLYGEIGAVVGCVLALTAVPGIALAAVTLLVVVAGIGQVVVLVAGASGSAAAATVVVVGVLFIGLAPRAAGLLTAGAWLRPPSSAPEPEADPDWLAGQVTRARRALILITAVCALAAGAALPVLARDPRPFPLALAAVASLALLLRAGTFEFLEEAAAPLLAALTGAFAAIAALAHWSAARPLLLPLLLVTGLAAICVGVPVLLWHPGTAHGRRERPGGAAGRHHAALSLCQLVLPALLFGVYGGFGALYHLGNHLHL
jgi:type VII secretion integral membrane protein EccD